ncbi:MULTISPECIES: thiamine pyrophosphate-binding protein [unclassified Mesorhizobium]|uniref:thiamine pyrophosphate-binding protein n=1 Tax=unclassified Mesorhizobium TaxID=325217 RepID=UPI001AEDDD11|nr:MULTISPECIES: thiamine pyrophosphate-binding protein [unclassified Mesorhizobium]
MRQSELQAGIVSEPSPEWGSDVAAAMLRHLGIEYVTMNPGASYRGLHDSLVNFLGDERPKMLLCLHEDHVISIAHGYAKVRDRPMGAILHSNVGLMHGLMGIFNAYCDRMPMIVVGATGPIEPEKRRPWIDWIHTAKDQGALLRDYVKWDDEPRSTHGTIEAFLRGMQLTQTEPKAPVYICLDAGMQESRLTKQVELPPARYGTAPAAVADAATVSRIANLLNAATHPLFLIGRGSRSQADWDRRVELAEFFGATVVTSVLERAVFPTSHPLHVLPPISILGGNFKDEVAAADVILSLDWPDLNGLLRGVSSETHKIQATIINVSLDSHLHRGWSMDYFGLPPVDAPVLANSDRFVEQLLDATRSLTRGSSVSYPASTSPSGDYSPGPGIHPHDIEVALQRARGDRELTLAHSNLSWVGDVFDLRGPLDFLGHDGGGGLAAGPGLTVGAALALKDTSRLVVGVLGDGDFLQGVTALWTAAHYQLPALFIVSNNRSNFNDELHQEAVAKVRSRETANRWIGQRIDDPAVDLSAMARSQGVQAEGPVETIEDLESAIARGLDAVREGRPYLIDVLVGATYAPPSMMSRG